ncbi:rod shape-determining protein MreC [Patescibacteria group bacterium]|nr:rod shape-determining protein MreC [Patescibacteria group bacterium]
MQKKVRFTSIFLVLIVASALILGISRLQFFRNFTIVPTDLFASIRKEMYGNYIKIVTLGGNNDLEKLKEENQDLRKKLLDQKKLQEDNNALRDQFQTTKIKSTSLIQADIIGAPSFVPGVSLPEFLVLNKGLDDGANLGDAVIYKDNLIGKITKISSSISTVTLVSNGSISLTAKTGQDNKVEGVIKGQGSGEMLLDNVLLSENLKKDDLVLTKGDADPNGQGFPPDLIVGKIVSIDKNPSALFQKADVVSFVNFSKLTRVFIFIK